MRLADEYPQLACLKPDMKKHELVQEITIAFATAGENLTPSKADRLAKRYKKELLLAETAPCITYADPTGDKAVGNVIREQKRTHAAPASNRMSSSSKNQFSLSS